MDRGGTVLCIPGKSASYANAGGCKGEQCLSIIGEQLEVDRIITTSYSKIDENVFFITANFTNLQNGSLLISQTEEHDGQSTTFKKLLEQLAFKMLGESKQKKYN